MLVNTGWRGETDFDPEMQVVVVASGLAGARAGDNGVVGGDGLPGGWRGGAQAVIVAPSVVGQAAGGWQISDSLAGVGGAD